MPYESIRTAMIDDVERRYPPGSSYSLVEQGLGKSEADFADICSERKADRCLFYHVGAEGIEPIVYVIGFRGDRSFAYWKREL